MKDIKPGMKCAHYKHPDKLYEIVGFAHHTETLEELVVYKAMYETKEFGKNAIWARPKEMFLGTVTIDGKEVPRFKEVE